MAAMQETQLHREASRSSYEFWEIFSFHACQPGGKGDGRTLKMHLAADINVDITHVATAKQNSLSLSLSLSLRPQFFLFLPSTPHPFQTDGAEATQIIMINRHS